MSDTKQAPKPFFFMSRAAAEKLRIGAQIGLPNYDTPTTVTLQRAFDDDLPLYDQAALDAAALAGTRKATEYYRAGLERRPPKWVPSKVRLQTTVRGDFPIGHTSIAGDGVHDCECNRYGAVTVVATDGKRLGLKPSEFEVVEWRENAG